MGLKESIHERREEIVAISQRHGAGSIRLFGSVAHGLESSDSDVDFLVELEPGRSLFDLGGLVSDLQDLLGRRVDVVTPKGLHWYIRERVLSEARPL
ncbi:MAG: nucleotidyltransferase family protein [Desulfobulbaceae bacterium]|nr:nucleotidyltransferase family protein [Desulfobulbaceae bacterium]